MTLRIRPSTPKDCDELLATLCDVFGHDYKTLANDYISAMSSNSFRKPTFLLAFLNDKLIGCAAYTEELFTVDVWGISWVAVREEYRSQGYGKKIIEECLKQIRKNILSTVTVILTTYPEKTSLYSNLGFKMLGDDHVGGSFMTLTLTPL